MGDAKDILFGARSSPSTPNSRRKQVKNTKKKCPEGVNREVFELQRDNETELALSLGTLSEQPSLPFRTKRSFDQQAQKWEYRPFVNAARGDELKLYHWDKASAQPDREYYFTRFNKVAEQISYTDEEYEKHLKDPKWTKEETDALVDLCNRFDARFIVVADRFHEINPEKTIEDLRARYYTVCRYKVANTLGNDKKALAEHHLFKYKYNPEHEKQRKIQAEKLYNRTTDSVNEEKRLATEFKRIDTVTKKSQQDRKRIFQLLDSVISPSDTPNRKRRKRSELLAELDDTVTTASPIGGRGGRRDRGSGAYARSSKMQTPLPVGAILQKKVDEALDGLSIPRRPTPTARVVKEYNELRHDVVALMELQAFMKKRQIEQVMFTELLKLETANNTEMKEQSSSK